MTILLCISNPVLETVPGGSVPMLESERVCILTSSNPVGVAVVVGARYRSSVAGVSWVPQLTEGGSPCLEVSFRPWGDVVRGMVQIPERGG